LLVTLLNALKATARSTKEGGERVIIHFWINFNNSLPNTSFKSCFSRGLVRRKRDLLDFVVRIRRKLVHGEGERLGRRILLRRGV
jgi:hypothetical protein